MGMGGEKQTARQRSNVLSLIKVPHTINFHARVIMLHVRV